MIIRTEFQIEKELMMKERVQKELEGISEEEHIIKAGGFGEDPPGLRRKTWSKRSW